MTQEFEQYIHNTRNEFVSAVNKLQWDTGFRTKCENLLIAYDQMKQALRQQPVSGECEHPYHAVLGDGEMQPAKCLKCGKVL